MRVRGSKHQLLMLLSMGDEWRWVQAPIYPEPQFSPSEHGVMNDSAVVALFLGIFLSLNPSIKALLTSDDDGLFRNNLEYTYNVTTSVTAEVKETVFTMKLKCRGRTNDTVSCRLEDPQYHTIYRVSPCNKSHDSCNKEYLRADNSYIGRFEIKYRAWKVEKLLVSAETSFKQLSFYRIIAGLLFPGVDVSDKPEGTYTLVEESVYGECQALVKVVRTKIKTERGDKFAVVSRDSVNETSDEHNNSTKTFHEMLSVKRTRNLESCYPVPALLVFDTFFYHPMMTSVHYDVKSSISRMIVRERAFTSYTSEDIAMKNLKPAGNITMLHVGTLLTLHSIEPNAKSISSISAPVAVELPFVDGFDPLRRNNDTSNHDDKSNNTVNNNNNNTRKSPQ